jgi:hypothetical protein
LSEEQVNAAIQRFRDNINGLYLTKSERDNIQDLFILMLNAYHTHFMNLTNNLETLRKENDALKTQKKTDE